MASSRTTSISTGWGSIQSVILMLLFSLSGIVLTGGRVVEGAFAGAFLFLVHRLLIVGMVLCRDHRRGISLTRGGDIGGALAAFERSASVWQSRAWLDRRRGWLMGSASRWPFHARALYNQGHCLSRLGRDHDALAVLDALLETHGEMGIALELRGAILASSAPAPPDDGAWDEFMQEA